MTANTSPVDVLLYIALNEEFDVAMQVLGEGFEPQELPDVALTCFFGDIPSPVLRRNVRMVVVPAGKMGSTRAATVTSAIIEKLSPANVVVLGIAGSLINDLEPGDVFVPASVNEYLANSATTDKGESWSFHTSGNQFQTSVRLLDRFQLFKHIHRAQHRSWQSDTAKERGALIGEEIQAAMRSAGLTLREDCKLFVGDDRKLASGPAVGKGRVFLEWLTREVDRKVVAIEMESAGVYDAAIIRTPAPRAIAIRGISDYADERKEKIESAAKLRFRELAAKNALSLLIRGIEAGLLEPDSPSSVEVSAHGTSVAASRVKSAFVIGGVTAETNDTDAELPRLHKASLKLGRLLADAGADLLICSPFPDSVDYYVAMGYAEGTDNGVIHLHSPNHPKVVEKRDLLVKSLGREGLVFQDWKYPGPDNDESWSQAWLLAQLQALERADLVVALGGKVSKTANTLLHLAEAKGVPIVPFAFLGGAARRAFGRRDWKRLNPGLDTSVMERDVGIERAIDVANRLILDRVERSFKTAGVPRVAFVSFAQKDADFGREAVFYLKSRGMNVMFGDNELREDQMVEASIQQALLKSDLCVVLWSRNYALSPWCYDEFSIATDRQSQALMRVWLFNLDDSLVVPTWARKLPAISARTPLAMVDAIAVLLSRRDPRDAKS